MAIIRISGPDSHSICKKHLRRFPTQAACLTKTAFFCDADPLDDLLAVRFDGPHSFTGEDCVELQFHGSPYIARRILATLIRSGCREARPGEFTKRSFLNGKIDLSSAEGLNDLIRAESHQQWVVARSIAQGRLAQQIADLRNSLRDALALLAAQIDFPDEGETVNLKLDPVCELVAAVRSQIDRLHSSYNSGRVASTGLSVALAGPPNSGKSTLMNALLATDRAIVTPQAGTTRDYLEERCLVEGRLIRLIDTAGLRSTDDQLEKLGIQRSQDVIRDADLIVLLAAADQDEPQQALANEIAFAGKTIIKCLSKSDLGNPAWGRDMIPISAVRGALEPLAQRLVAAVDSHVSQVQEGSVITSHRHRDALAQALRCLDRFASGLAQKTYEECLSFELQEASRALGAIVGEIDTEDLLDKIFADFCIGK